MTLTWLCMVLVVFMVVGCQQGSDTMTSRRQALDEIKSVMSLSGASLTPPVMDEETLARLETNLARAQDAYDRNPDDPENIIWLGRRTAYLWGYHEAIAIYTEGLRKHPDNYKLLRHRGHRYISVREFDKAIADMERATQLIEGVLDQPAGSFRRQP